MSLCPPYAPYDFIASPVLQSLSNILLYTLLEWKISLYFATSGSIPWKIDDDDDDDDELV
jgi:hypothetical protein